MQEVESKTDRQERIPKWNQAALDNASVVLIGSGPLCNYVATALTGLRVGTKNSLKAGLEIFDNSRIADETRNEFLLSVNRQERGASKVKCLESVISIMNEDMRVVGYHSPFVGTMVPNASIVVDLTNNPRSKERSLEFAVDKGIPYVSASTDVYSGVVVTFNPSTTSFTALSGITIDKFVHKSFAGKIQGAFPSGVIGAVVVDEIRRYRFKLNEDEFMLTRPVYYNLLSAGRLSLATDYGELDLSQLSKKKIAIVGAGALGNFVGINLSLMGIGSITFIDYDTISNSNRNRQPCYTLYRCNGKKKVAVIKGILSKFNPNTEINGIDAKVVDSASHGSNGETNGKSELLDVEMLRDYDLIVSCLDNAETRLVLNRFISRLYKNQQQRIPLVDGSTSDRQGSANVYIPGVGPCINCQANYSSLLGKQSMSCPNANIHPSVVYTNMAAASVMSGEILMILSGNPQNALTRPLFYHSMYPERLRLRQDKVGNCEICRF